MRDTTPVILEAHDPHRADRPYITIICQSLASAFKIIDQTSLQKVSVRAYLRTSGEAREAVRRAV